MNKKISVFGSSLFLIASFAVAAEDEPTIKQLDWLIGAWDFEDAEIKGEYREAGTRVCEYALDDYYIVCESHGTSHTGKQRTYLNYFNYNRLNKRFEMITVFGGFPHKLLYKIRANENGQRLEMDSGAWEGDQITFDGHAVITYNGSDQYTWESASFRDIATRNKDY